MDMGSSSTSSCRPDFRNATQRASGAGIARLGVVSFLNTRPIIDGLDEENGISLVPLVPSELIGALLEHQVDVALCSSIDYLRSPVPMTALSVAPLTCDGPTLTVRLFSRTPMDAIDRIACDTDSHTSVALLRILLRDLWGRSPEIVSFDPHAHDLTSPWPDTVMLIGDKVVQHPPPDTTHPYVTDLGQAWKELTGLPFVFAFWMAPASTDSALLEHAGQSIERCLHRNLGRMESLITIAADEHGWPRPLAAGYLNGLIRYELGPGQLEGLRMFHERAVHHGIAAEPRPLTFIGA